MQYGIDIEKFLVGKSFFVTGATGFLAKGIYPLSFIFNTLMCVCVKAFWLLGQQGFLQRVYISFKFYL